MDGPEIDPDSKPRVGKRMKRFSPTTSPNVFRQTDMKASADNAAVLRIQSLFLWFLCVYVDGKKELVVMEQKQEQLRQRDCYARGRQTQYHQQCCRRHVYGCMAQAADAREVTDRKVVISRGIPPGVLPVSCATFHSPSSSSTSSFSSSSSSSTSAAASSSVSVSVSVSAAAAAASLSSSSPFYSLLTLILCFLFFFS